MHNIVLAALAKAEPDCVVLDMHLPGIHGAGVTRLVREAHAHFPIVGLTARPDSSVIMGAMKLGVRVMLTKPISSGELIE